MRYNLILAFFLIASVAQADFLPPIPTINFGGSAGSNVGGTAFFSNPVALQINAAQLNSSGPNFKTLTFFTSTGSGKNFYGFYDVSSGLSSLYTVPAGKTLRVVQVCGIGASGAIQYTLGNSPVSFSQGTGSQPAGSICEMDGSACGNGNQERYTGPNGIQTCYNMPITFGATTYPMVMGNSMVGGVQMIGIETTP